MAINKIRWGIAVILFVVMAVVSLYYLFSTAVIHKEAVDGSELMNTPSSGLTVQGMQLRYKAWTTYPEYNVGFGILSVIGFAGSAFSVYSMSKGRELDHDEDS